MSVPTQETDPTQCPLFFKVLGRTLEHFGVQMYKRREVAIAELVANCWDAGATEVFIEVPEPNAYNRITSRITIRDSGHGMSHDEVQQAYLVLGRNRRKEGGELVQACLPLDFSGQPSGQPAESKFEVKKRRVMGRKGIGKLAGFGLAQKMTVTTWRAGTGLEFYLDLKDLKLKDNASDNVPIKWKWLEPDAGLGVSGTIVTLEVLKHNAALNVEKLRLSLARRFSRMVRGEMQIQVNGIGLPDPTPSLDYRFPDPASGNTLEEHKLPNGNIVKYWFGFASDIIHERELRGFSILVHGKVAQAPPYFFDIEAHASGQHSTRYVIGEIEADFADNGADDEGDLVSTDRQEIDWDAEAVQSLKVWGEKLSLKVLSDCRDFRGKRTAEKILTNPDIERRVSRLDRQSQKEIKRFLGILGDRDEEEDGRTGELAGALVRAYEFRQFHDVIEDIEAASSDPNKLAAMLSQLNEWRVLESRAILEIIKGRLEILDKFEKMLCNNAPETASSKSLDNMHDLLAGNPWLLNPEWQVLAEEKKITTQLREWGLQEVSDYNGRYDFLALGSDGMLAVVEIKRADYAAELPELNRLTEYAERLSIGHARPIKMVFICGREPKVSGTVFEGFLKNPNFEIRYWNTLFQRTRKVYEHYRAVLECAVTDPAFAAKQEEVLRTRHLLQHGIHRDSDARAQGIPPQDGA